ncbi:hypothetical protein PVC01_070038500 [Plasmodium vivax]|uniref:(malaria parasite P. vivax) hypothetical protein n=1 Tax=Plasmodium vivax TaxID=5855 RepID=A0A1G4GVQ2_PLAVI|nr:unnamed protein product [Plasmodium vivax]CAI7719796.1 hypothetical protein PVPAM_070041000 [Plasmodium vivax]SCO66675.1 hypothetical protein PVT01_070038900 [Plasmodium vivax]SCO72107.1 hypothetical protein PVC01_070038500 [Plasmodium vivax]
MLIVYITNKAGLWHLNNTFLASLSPLYLSIFWSVVLSVVLTALLLAVQHFGPDVVQRFRKRGKAARAQLTKADRGPS